MLISRIPQALRLARPPWGVGAAHPLASVPARPSSGWGPPPLETCLCALDPAGKMPSPTVPLSVFLLCFPAAIDPTPPSLLNPSAPRWASQPPANDWLAFTFPTGASHYAFGNAQLPRILEL
ncbi:hypothetical protein ACG7TL_000904 [Trametes sanguinea]